jgi:hypothetical protein
VSRNLTPVTAHLDPLAQAMARGPSPHEVANWRALPLRTRIRHRLHGVRPAPPKSQPHPPRIPPSKRRTDGRTGVVATDLAIAGLSLQDLTDLEARLVDEWSALRVEVDRRGDAPSVRDMRDLEATSAALVAVRAERSRRLEMSTAGGRPGWLHMDTLPL